jgi:hypothetical protein
MSTATPLTPSPEWATSAAENIYTLAGTLAGVGAFRAIINRREYPEQYAEESNVWQWRTQRDDGQGWYDLKGDAWYYRLESAQEAAEAGLVAEVLYAASPAGLAAQLGRASADAWETAAAAMQTARTAQAAWEAAAAAWEAAEAATV